MNMVNCKIKSGKDKYVFKVIHQIKAENEDELYLFTGTKNGIEYTSYSSYNIYDPINELIEAIKQIKRPEY